MSHAVGETAGVRVSFGTLWILHIPPQPLNADYDGKSLVGSGGL